MFHTQIPTFVREDARQNMDGYLAAILCVSGIPLPSGKYCLMDSFRSVPKTIHQGTTKNDIRKTLCQSVTLLIYVRPFPFPKELQVLETTRNACDLDRSFLDLSQR